MMDYTDKHFRYLVRLLSRNILLFTEMITAPAIVHGDSNKLLSYNAEEHPVVLQLGGSNIQAIKEASLIGQQYGYDEININVGCPSHAVVAGEFGARLMLKAKHVSEMMKVLIDCLSIPVSIKCRIGVDQHDSYEFLVDFIGQQAKAGCKVFYVHARKAYLKGLSPKENRTVPPLQYDKVLRLKKDFPDLTIIINGGITELSFYENLKDQIDGVMLGRAAYHNLALLREVDSVIFSEKKCVPLRNIIDDYLDYVAKENPNKIFYLTKHLQGLCFNRAGAKQFRKTVVSPSASIDGIRKFLDHFELFE